MKKNRAFSSKSEGFNDFYFKYASFFCIMQSIVTIFRNNLFAFNTAEWVWFYIWKSEAETGTGRITHNSQILLQFYLGIYRIDVFPGGWTMIDTVHQRNTQAVYDVCSQIPVDLPISSWASSFALDNSYHRTNVQCIFYMLIHPFFIAF